MKLEDAIKSGKPRRLLSTKVVCADIKSWHYASINTYHDNDILSDDWEIQEPTVTITRSQLNSALVSCPIGLREKPEITLQDLARELAKRLGLE